MFFTSPDGNFFAFFVLVLWPIINVFIYSKVDPLRATFICLVGGYLLLPTGVYFDFPLIPPFDKSSISSLSAFFCLRFVAKTKIGFLPVSKTHKWLILIFIIIPIISVRNNPEPVIWLDGTFLPGLSLHDGVSLLIRQYIELIPFVLATYLIKTYEDQLELFKLTVIAALLYTIPVLFEIRMSPQLHTWIYGYFPHSFAQMARYEGFRPVVFLGHGLLISVFIAVSLGFAALLWRSKEKFKYTKSGKIVAYLTAVLLLAKSLGPFLYGLFMLLTIRICSASTAHKLALILASIFVLYPVLTLQNIFPREQVLDLANTIDKERAYSLQFRFDQEYALLKHAEDKYFFGWGSHGRNTLQDSITDGYWIIILGQFGVVGFAAIALLFWYTVWRAGKASNILVDQKAKIALSMHALVVSVILIDQLPNASLNLFSLFIIGGLAGRTYHIIRLKAEMGYRFDTTPSI